jgi:hypothetical protein
MLSETQMVTVAARAGVVVSVAALALSMSPMGPRENLVHGLAALEEYRAEPRGPKAMQHLLYAHRRLHEADRIMADYARAAAAHRGRRARWNDCRERLTAAMRDLMACEARAARDAETAHLPVNDNG